MPFLNPDRKPQIIHPEGHKVDVCITFNTLGNIKPLFFRIEDDNCERFTYKLSSSFLQKDYNYIMLFYCKYDAYGKNNNIMLVYDVIKCLWTIG